MISTYKDTRAGSGQKAKGIQTIVELLIKLGVQKSTAEKQGRMYYRYLEMPEVEDIISKLQSKDAKSWVLSHPIFSTHMNEDTTQWIKDIQKMLTKDAMISRNIYLMPPDQIRTLISILHQRGYKTQKSEDGKTLTIYNPKKTFKEFYLDIDNNQ